ncbi:MAG: double zinc ribbon domain-containing protein, partial [Candidatus Brocadiia bacterium]
MAESAPAVWLRGTRALAGAFLDWVFPRHCYDCGEPIHEPGRNVLCPTCTNALLERRIDRHFCAGCGLPLPGHADGESLCLTCMAEERYFDRARSFFPYDSPIAPVVRAYKFRGDFFLGPRLLKGILRSAGAPPDIETPSAVVAVPLHPRRL